MNVHTQPTCYTVSALPADHREHGHFSLTVEWRGDDRWAVCNSFRECMNIDGNWSHESRPSERTDEWEALHRFNLDTALRLAEHEAPNMTCNGYTVADVLPWGAQ